MKNVKGIAFANDGEFKRIAVTYDVIDDEGRVIGSNLKFNRIVMDKDMLTDISELWRYAQELVDSEEQ